MLFSEPVPSYKTHHSGLSTSLLTLEEDSITILAVRALCRAARQRWVRANILGDTSSLAYRVVENVAEDAGGDGVFLVLACATGKGELVRVRVFFWVEHVGARSVLKRVSNGI